MRLCDLEWTINWVAAADYAAVETTRGGVVAIHRRHGDPPAYNLFFFPADGGGNYTNAYHRLDELTAQAVLYELLKELQNES